MVFCSAFLFKLWALLSVMFLLTVITKFGFQKKNNKREKFTVKTEECVYKKEQDSGMKRIYPNIVGPWTQFDRFSIEIFKEPNFKTRLTSLKDSTEQTNSVEVRYPIRSIRIRTLPNDNWRFLQTFSLVIYLKHDPSYRVIFKSPRNARGIDYLIADTKSNEELLGWMSRFEPKIVHFTTGEYNPLSDLYNESFFHRRLLNTPESSVMSDDPPKNKFLWINENQGPDF